MNEKCKRRVGLRSEVTVGKGLRIGWGVKLKNE